MSICNCSDCNLPMRCIGGVTDGKISSSIYLCEGCGQEVSLPDDSIPHESRFDNFHRGESILNTPELRKKLDEIAEAILNKPIPEFIQTGLYVHPNCRNIQRQSSTKQLKWNAVKREMIENANNKERLERLKKLLRDTEDNGAYELCRPILNNIINLEIKVLVSDSIIEY